MFLKKKTIVVETAEKILLKIINDTLTEKEKAISFNFNRPRKEFVFCGMPYFYDSESYKCFDFVCAIEQMNRAFDLLKNALVKIKNSFLDKSINVELITRKIFELLELEKQYQLLIKDEKIKWQENGHKGVLFSSIELFEAVSKKYLEFVISTKTALINFVKKELGNYNLIASVDSNIKEIKMVLPKGICDYNNNLSAYAIIYNIENFLRILVIIILKGLKPKEMFGEDLLKRIDEKKQNEQKNKWCDERYGGDLFYLSLGELYEVMKRKEKIFNDKGIILSKIQSEIDKITTIRHKLAHNNNITDDDINTLKVYSNTVYKYCIDYAEEIKGYKFNLIAKRKKDK